MPRLSVPRWAVGCAIGGAVAFAFNVAFVSNPLLAILNSTVLTAICGLWIGKGGDNGN